MASRHGNPVPRWAEHPLPEAVGAVWRWEVAGPAELSVIRADIRRRVDAASGVPDAASEAAERLLLAFEELASNGLRHGGEPVRVAITVTDSGWLLDVSDAGGGDGPEAAVGRDPARGGLGLYLTAALATGFGWMVAGTRRHVWACVPFGPDQL